MKLDRPHHPEPEDAAARRTTGVLICYPIDTLPEVNLGGAQARRARAELVQSVKVPARHAVCVDLPAGHFARILSVEGPQVGDLNIWNTHNIAERF